MVSAVAQAAQATNTADILYVNNRTTCSDSTTDSSATPYCTVQAAADVVEPGQTVQIAPGGYAAGLTITRSGTAAAPIRFVGTGYSTASVDGQRASLGNGDTASTGYVLTISGASDVEVAGLYITGEGAGTVDVTGSSAVELDHDSFEASAPSGIEVGQGSASVKIDDDDFDGPRALAVRVDPGVTGTTITNDIVTQGLGGVLVDGAAGTDVTGDTFLNLGADPGVDVSGGATATAIENDIVDSGSAAAIGIRTDAASAAGTTSDYNIDYVPGSSAPYSWGATTYTSAADLEAATGQGAHDLNTNPHVVGGWAPAEGSPAINSGDAAAPGEPATDIYGTSRALDPHDPVTGTGGGYYDRGAVQIADPIKVGLTESKSWGAGTLTETFTGSLTAAPWSSSVAYTYDFGDGTTQTTSSSTITHTFTKPGNDTVDLTATDADHGTATASQSLTVGNGNAYYPVTPVRVLDTRNGTGTGVAAKVPANGSVTLTLAGRGSFPASGAVAAVLNVTVVSPGSNGFLTVYPDGTSLPNASNLNFARGEIVPNLVTVEVGEDGKVVFHNTSSAPTDLVADLEGYYAPGAGSSYASIFPARVASEKVTAGTPTQVSVNVAQMGDWYAPQATAVALNVTVTKGTANGFLSVYPAGSPVPTASNLNYAAGETVANMVIVPVSSDGLVNLYVGGKAGAAVTVDLDVEGYYSTSNEGDGFTPVSPVRLIDTRSGLGLPSKGQTCCIQVNPTTLKAIPAAAGGIVVNTTVVNPSANGYLTAYWGFGVNTTNSNINFAKGEVIPNMIMLTIPGSNYVDDLLDFDVNGGVQTDLVVDMFGYFS